MNRRVHSLFAHWPAALALCACASVGSGASGDGGPVDAGPPPPPSLIADPPTLGYDCVAPGCHQSKSLKLTSNGQSTARVYSIQLDLASSHDFQLVPGTQPPYDLAPGATKDVTVAYVPSDARADTGTLLIEYGSPTTGASHSVLRVDLIARLIGDAQAEVTPSSLSFGYIAQGQSGNLDVSIQNVGTGNALLEVPAAALRTGVDFYFAPAFPPSLIVGPGETKKITVTYRPTNVGVHQDTLIVQTSDPQSASVEIPLRGTSIQEPRAAVSPTGPFALGDVRVGGSATQMLQLTDLGGMPLAVSSVQFTGPGAGFYQVNPASLMPIAPFASSMLTVTYTPTGTGDHSATMAIQSNDPMNPTVNVAFTAQGIDPRLVVSPSMVDYGPVVQGWMRGPTAVEARNDGFGPLQIQRVYLAPGSSPEIQLSNVPGLPITLNGGNRQEFDLSYTSATLSMVRATLVIESDDPGNAHVEVPITAQGVTCADGCPMAHAIPTCTSGTCQIAMCDSGYYDTDGNASTGCECKIETPEPSNLCAGAMYKGSFTDDPSSSIDVGGQLHSKDDVDWFNFYAVDTGGISQTFSDAYKVQITLTGPPGYKMCVFRVKRTPHSDVCPNEASSPCTGTTSYGPDSGSPGPDDSSDYFVKVYTDQDQNLCGNYTIHFSNG
jgi:hypothetical protein